jgi:hypothetical protein
MVGGLGRGLGCAVSLGARASPLYDAHRCHVRPHFSVFADIDLHLHGRWEGE